MLSKSDRTKAFILEQAKLVFKNKGYKTVTMTDIVKECDISRGGLYRYFKNTKEIFLALIKLNHLQANTELEEGIKNKQSATELLNSFLEREKSYFLQEKNKLTTAIYEFYFEHKSELQVNWLQNQFNRAEKIITELLQYGKIQGEFYPHHSSVVAKHILFLLEGLRVSNEVMHLDDIMIDEQLDVIKNQLIRESNHK